ncbi:hypothetical protein C8J55DRAFT_563698 [Lentinula edodes]|uniref:protein-tyrosine-phosphatase n=1 Tax=Lentinula lateritia TaxID=40482 RepID=A0A9W9DIZ4_9AGAR|nr:hypothetical protein C8J55DRAFT_563698 [Lentinula edodes]
MDQDFFGTKPDTGNLGDDVDTFARAISERSIFNPAMNAKDLSPVKPKLPLSTTNSKPSSSFSSVEPIHLLPFINNTSALIIDIRPHAAYSSARIPTALSLSVPSTLLKRPLFSLDRLGAMLPSSSARSRFTEWPKFTTIVVYDVDSIGSPFLPEGNNILGLLRKFSNDAAYNGNTLLWLKGGFQRVWREHRDLVDFRPPEPEPEDDANEPGSLKTNHLPPKAFGSGTTTRNSLNLSSPRKRPPSAMSLRANAPLMSEKTSDTSSVPFNPFFDTIRQNIELTQGITERIPLRLPKRVRKRIDDLPFEWLREISRRADVKPDDSFTSDGDESPPSTSENKSNATNHPSPKSSSKLLPPGIHYERPTSPIKMSKQHLTPPPPNQALLDEGMEALAMQFYRIELAEQRRLMGVMKHHSAESGVVTSQTQAHNKDVVESADSSAALGLRPHVPESADYITAHVSLRSVSPSPQPGRMRESFGVLSSNKPSNVSSGPTVPLSISESDSDYGRDSKTVFPYSITAGVEKGAKNRYRNIWPFEHARVKLHARRHSPSRKSAQSEGSFQPSASTVSPSSSTSSIRHSGALTGPITSLSGSPTSGASVSRSVSDATKSPRSSNRMKTRRGVKPSFGSGGLGGLSSPSFNFPSSSLTAPVIFNSASAIGGSALKPSFTHMRAPPPAAGSGGETTESEHEHDDSEKEATSEDHDDYVNASFVQPLCTTRRYIATQGPLEATFVDFWTLVYQQNVHVIIMLTREIEGSMVKCGPYWKDEVFGPLRLKLMSVEGNVDEGKDDDVRRKAGGGDPAAGGFFFSSPVVTDTKHGKKKKRNPADAIIKRTFLLSHVGYPDIPPRKIVQFQYLEWPDMNVPDDPRGVLGLIKEVDQAVTEAMHLNGLGEEEDTTNEVLPSNIEAGVPVFIRPPPSRSRSGLEESLNRNTGIANEAMGRKHSPVLLHCSAGVGRTGGFIAVDAVLDGIRREFRKKKKLTLYQAQNDNNVSWNTPGTMDIDLKNEETAVQDEQGYWNRTGNRDVDMTASKMDLRTVAIPAPNSGNILHVPVHTSNMVRCSYHVSRIALGQESNNDLLTPTALFPTLYASQDNNSNTTSASSNNPFFSSPQTPMQVDGDYYTSSTTGRNRDEKKINFSRQSSTTRMWAEDVSDQTGSHGTAFRVDEAVRQMHSQNRLSEWDVSKSRLKAQIEGIVEHTSSGDPRSMDVNISGSSRPTSSMPGQDIATTQGVIGPQSDGAEFAARGRPGSAPSVFPSSSIDSASSSDDSYDFKNGFKGMLNHRIGHHTNNPLSHAQSIHVVIGEGRLPALNFRGEEARLRTWSAPSAQRIQTVADTDSERTNRTDDPESQVLRNVAFAFTSSPLVIGDHSRDVEKSPSPFSRIRGIDRDESASLPPPSRSLSPPNRTDVASAPLNQQSSDKNEGLVTADFPPTSAMKAKSLPTNPTFHSVPSVGVENESAEASVYSQSVGTQNVDHRPFIRDARASSSSVDFSFPRPLHNDQSPQALSNLGEPLMEVLQDMREQRMSLCQSLRQYVFVHAAIIEGTLMIVDEERERERNEMRMDVDDISSMKQAVSSITGPSSSSSRHSWTTTTGKRVASPTELPKEDKKGDQMLFKKPSIKKKLVLSNRSPDPLVSEMA